MKIYLLTPVDGGPDVLITAKDYTKLVEKISNIRGRPVSIDTGTFEFIDDNVTLGWFKLLTIDDLNDYLSGGVEVFPIGVKV
jgi:hypothetical protein